MSLTGYAEAAGSGPARRAHHEPARRHPARRPAHRRAGVLRPPQGRCASRPSASRCPTLRHEGDDHRLGGFGGPRRGLRPLGIVDAVWDVRLHLDVDGVRTTTRLTAAEPGLATGGCRSGPRLTRLVADHIEPADLRPRPSRFRLVARQAGRPRSSPAACGARPAGSPSPATGRRRRLRKKAHLRRHQDPAVPRGVPAAAVKKRLVVFESHLGRQYSDSPRAIYEEMRRQGLDFEAVWSYTGSPEGFPSDATLVRRWSLPYLQALARAEFWVDNQGYPAEAHQAPARPRTSRPGTARRSSGWASTSRSWKLKTRAEQAEQQRTLDRFDHFLVRSEHDVRTLAGPSGCGRRRCCGWATRATTRSCGRQREPSAAARTPAARRRVGHPRGQEGPAVRAHVPAGTAGSAASSCPSTWSASPTSSATAYVLLVRSHYLNHVVLPPSVRGPGHRRLGAPRRDPAARARRRADHRLLVRDVRLRAARPADVFFAYDYEEYVHEGRGTYFDLLEQAPGPVVRTEDELYSPCTSRVRGADAQVRRGAASGSSPSSASTTGATPRGASSTSSSPQWRPLVTRSGRGTRERAAGRLLRLQQRRRAGRRDQLVAPDGPAVHRARPPRARHRHHPAPRIAQELRRTPVPDHHVCTPDSRPPAPAVAPPDASMREQAGRADARCSGRPAPARS